MTNNFTAEEVRKEAARPWHEGSTAARMLLAYAALLEQRAAGVTDGVVDAIGSALYIYWNDVTKRAQNTYRGKVRAALRSVWPVAAESSQPADSGRVGNTLVEKARKLAEIVRKQCGGYVSGPGFDALTAAHELDTALAAQGQGEVIPADAWREAAADILGRSSNLYRMLCEQAKEYASSVTPASPAGVPDAKKYIEYADCRDRPHAIGYQDGWNACRLAMLAAPSAPEGDGLTFQERIALEVGADERDRDDIINHVVAWVKASKDAQYAAPPASAAGVPDEVRKAISVLATVANCAPAPFITGAINTVNAWLAAPSAPEGDRKRGHAPDCNVNMADLAYRIRGCDCESAPDGDGGAE